MRFLFTAIFLSVLLSVGHCFAERASEVDVNRVTNQYLPQAQMFLPTPDEAPGPDEFYPNPPELSHPTFIPHTPELPEAARVPAADYFYPGQDFYPQTEELPRATEPAPAQIAPEANKFIPQPEIAPSAQTFYPN